MSANRLLSNTVKYVLVAAAGAAAIPIVHAAESGAATVQEVVVTGSRIQRQDYESASPVVTVSEQAFEQSGTTTVETLLNTLPQFVPSVTNTSNNPSNNGQANVELRGLNTKRTLVLLDGKRIVPANDTGEVDVNMLPASLIGNVEIITGGASAVYGSDAIAGVVNFKTRDYEGFEINSDWGQTGRSDGQEYQVSATGGHSFDNGRGKFVANLAYAKRDALLAGERDFSKVALGYSAASRTFSPNGSPTFLEGFANVAASQTAVDTVFAGYGVPNGGVTTRVFGFNSDGTLFSTGSGAPGSVKNFRGTKTADFNDANFTYNFAPTNYLQLPLERKTGFLRGSYEFSPAAEVYVQGIWAQYDANTQLAPTPGSSLYVPVTNPFVSAGLRTLLQSRATPNAPFIIGKRLSELGPRFENNHYSVYQAMTGLRGKVGGDWSYDIYASYGKVSLDNTQLGSISRTKFESLTFAADGGQAACGGLNPFGLGSISQKCAEYVTVDAVNTQQVKQTIAEGSVTGPLFSLPAGELKVAFGALYKKDESAFIADEQLRAKTTGAFGLPVRVDVAGFNASDNTLGSTHSTEVYTEVLVPLLADLPGVRKLDATVGYRYADYSSAGGVNSYKAELMYKPANPLMFRGAYERAVRAPSIGELFQPQVTNFPRINPPDPCSVGSKARTGANAAAVRSLCLAQGMPASLIDNYSFNATQVEGLTGGNPNLHQETADTVTFGAVLHSPFENRWLSNLQLSVDWYRISIAQAIAVVSSDIFIDRCFQQQYNANFSTDNFYCKFFTRNPTTGNIFATQVQQNVGAIHTSGVDVQVDWAADVGPGRLGVNWVAGWLNAFDVQPIPGDAFTHYRSTIGSNIASAFPNWKWTFNVNYGLGGLGLNARWRYVGGMNSFSTQAFQLPAVSYLDAGASYGFKQGLLDGLVLRLGVTNVTDKQPQIYPGSVQVNTDPSTYDVLGRRYFLAAKYGF